jgi:MFS family permease
MAIGDGWRSRLGRGRASVAEAGRPGPPAPLTEPATGARRPRVRSLRTFESLRDRSFRWYFISMLGWFASMNMQQLARGVIVYDMTNSYAALGTISLANAIPGLFLALPGGLIADRISCKLIVQMGQLSNMVVAGAVAALMLTGAITFEYLLIGAVFQGGINAIIMPARQSMIPEIVGNDRLMNAVALSSAGTNIMRLAAPPVGGLLLTIIGPGWVYTAMATLYLAGAASLLPVRSRAEAIAEREARRATRGPSSRSLSGAFGEMVEGCRYMKRDRVIFIILAVSFMIVLLAQPYQMMLPGFAKDVLGASPSELGLLMSFTGLGALIGSLIIASMPARRRGLMLMSSALVMGVTTLCFSLSSILWLTAGIVFAIGIGQSLRMSLSTVLIQSYCNPEYRGRVMSVYMMEFSLVAFGTFFVGLLSNAIGVQAALASTAVGLIILSIGASLLVPRMRRLD